MLEILEGRKCEVVEVSEVNGGRSVKVVCDRVKTSCVSGLVGNVKQGTQVVVCHANLWL